MLARYGSLDGNTESTPKSVVDDARNIICNQEIASVLISH